MRLGRIGLPAGYATTTTVHCPDTTRYQPPHTALIYVSVHTRDSTPRVTHAVRSARRSRTHQTVPALTLTLYCITLILY